MIKQALRTFYLQRRMDLSEGEYLQLNYLLTEQFFASIDLSFVGVLHTFLPIEKNREVNTWQIIDRIRREFPNVRISIPKVNPTTNVLENFFFEGLHQLETNKWGIQEPKQGIPTPPEKIDIVLTPLLAFDEQGQRVGYGKGFYDKLFSTCRADVRRIGLSLFAPVEVIEDVNVFDQKLTQVVTPTSVWNF